jgi:hypothetical protein
VRISQGRLEEVYGLQLRAVNFGSQLTANNIIRLEMHTTKKGGICLDSDSTMMQCEYSSVGDLLTFAINFLSPTPATYNALVQRASRTVPENYGFFEVEFFRAWSFGV